MSKDKRKKDVRLAQIVQRADNQYGYSCVNLIHGGPQYTKEAQECVAKGYLQRKRDWRRKSGGRQTTKLYLTPKGKAFIKRHGYIPYEIQKDHTMEIIKRYHKHLPAFQRRMIMEQHTKKVKK